MRDVTTLPKAHLHLHFEATARPATIVELAARSGRDYDVPTAFRSFTEFNAAYAAVVELIREPDDVVRLCHEITADEAAQGVAYTQPMFAPGAYAERFAMSEAEVFDLMRAAFEEAAAAHGIEVGFIMAGIWTWPLEVTEAAARFAAERADAGVVGFGLAGVEPAGGYRRWARACDIAREAGLLIVPHAGEFGSASNVAEAVDILMADRIAHGVAAINDPTLVARLADAGIACDTCPTSNVVLGAYPSYAALPNAALLAAGVPITLNSDDQLFFGSHIANEYAIVRETFGLSDAEMAGIARASVDASGAPAATRTRIHRDINVWFDASN